MPRAEVPVYSVAELNAIVRELLEGEFGDIAVEGETSNVRVHPSGHVYFRLKDASAALNAVCFRGDARGLGFQLEDGVRVVARGRVTVYEPQGSYQLVARSIEPAGRGDLERAFRERVARLQAEGLFDETHKRALPRYPRAIAVVTSPSGAAIHDILSTIARRFPCVDVWVVPVQVQGDLAPGQIVNALDRLSKRGGIDVVIVGRGGGSIEDLWAFNDEDVARAIHRCSIPVISAVGHESDVTIADFVADRRAATPTMAAEIAVPDRVDVQRQLDAMLARMSSRTGTRLELMRRRVSEFARSYALGRVRGRIERAMQSVDHASDRLRLAAATTAAQRRARVDELLAGMTALNPAEVLRRGYSICSDARTGRVVRDADAAVAAGDVRLAFHDGFVAARVQGDAIHKET